VSVSLQQINALLYFLSISHFHVDPGDANLQLTRRNTIHSDVDCPGDNIVYTCITSSTDTGTLDLVWHVNVDGRKAVVAFGNDAVSNTSILIMENVFVSVEVFLSEARMVSRFTMVPELGRTLPLAVIQCEVTGLDISSVFHINAVDSRGNCYESSGT
jgi:hypothetical protein